MCTMDLFRYVYAISNYQVDIGTFNGSCHKYHDGFYVRTLRSNDFNLQNLFTATCLMQMEIRAILLDLWCIECKLS